MAPRWTGSGAILETIEATPREWEAVRLAVRLVIRYWNGGNPQPRPEVPPCLPLDYVAPFSTDPSRNHALHSAALQRCKELGLRFTANVSQLTQEEPENLSA